ncbi:26378_t:CDS:2 [Gigaspora margarita]|uniref:26378_t:CDS:1 n=1 Tax=Gigaspora margarita TaxID=4874 RepID=A0ABN7W4I0_GIGMA|nr:26378_t:CDS:2 [Gigaspora margarita]
MSFKCHHFVKWLLEKYESREENKKLNILGTIWIFLNCTKNIAIAVVVKDENILIHELDENIEALHLRNRMNILEYINYTVIENKKSNNKKDNSTEM